MTPHNTYATGINCMDGKVQGAVRKHSKAKNHVAHVDMITQPGIVRVLAENTNTARLELIREMIGISVVHHGSRAISIAAHSCCAGNPIGQMEQIEHLKMAKQIVLEMIDDLGLDQYNIEITLLWVGEDWMPVEINDNQFQVEEQFSISSAN